MSSKVMRNYSQKIPFLVFDSSLATTEKIPLRYIEKITIGLGIFGPNTMFVTYKLDGQKPETKTVYSSDLSIEEY